MRIYAGRDLHAFAWHQGPGRYRPDRRGSFPCWGVTIRVRDPRGTKCWRHVRVRLMLLGETPDGKGLMHFEVDAWRTVGGTGAQARLGNKVFFRVRAGR